MVEVIVVDSANQRKPRRRIHGLGLLLGIILILMLAVGGFVTWALIPAGDLMPEVAIALQSDNNITVSQRGWISFLPHDAPPTAGIILYPGARVQAEAYAPLARRIAEAGYLAAIVYAPINLSIFNPGAAQGVIENFSAVNIWVVGGHSLGGSAAAIYAADNRDVIDGLVFLAAYPSGDALVNRDIQVVSIYGTNDGIASTESVLKSGTNLPASTRFVAIEGGNHSQFGYYGFQPGDHEATITRDEQITQTVNTIVNLLESLSR